MRRRLFPFRPKAVELSRFRHAGLRWEALAEGADLVRSRDDWSMATLRREFAAETVRRNNIERLVFRLNRPPFAAAVKAQLSVGIKPMLRTLYGVSKGRKEWENHIRAHGLGLPVVTPLALGEQWEFGVVQEAVFISRWRPDTRTIQEWRCETADEAGGEVACDVARKLGQLVAAVQSHGIYHNEMHFRNVLIEDVDGGRSLLLIDWKHGRARGRITSNDLENLLHTGRFYTRRLPFARPTESEKRAFLAGYLGVEPDRPDRAEILAGLRAACPDETWMDEAFQRTGDTADEDRA
ncbi:MAG: lipopolysaccharide kinase InaA family protein [Planctomycetota bacterium]